MHTCFFVVVVVHVDVGHFLLEENNTILSHVVDLLATENVLFTSFFFLTMN